MKKTILLLLVFLSASQLFANITQLREWRWRKNDGNQTTATWLAAQSTAITINDLNTIRLRVILSNPSSDNRLHGTRLSYSKSATTGFAAVENTGDQGPFKLAGASAQISDLGVTTPQLTPSNTNTFNPGRTYTRTENGNDSIYAGKYTEIEWAITPTKNCEPGTTYYFKVDGLETPSGFNLPSLTTAATLPVPPKAITNGGFENALTDWTTGSATGTTADFQVSDTALHSGSKGLRAVVTNPAGNALAVQLAHTAFPTTAAHTYLLRFWAKANVEKAKLALALQGANTTLIAFQLYPDWSYYDYTFRTNDPSTIVKFFFQSTANYVLDDIELMDETSTIIDVPMTYMWQHNRTGYGWATADGDVSVGLPNGRAAWFFSDTWLANNDTLNNGINTNRLVNNCMVLQSAPPPTGRLTSYYKPATSTQGALAYFLPATSYGKYNFYWPRDPIIDDGKVKIMLLEVYVTPGPADTARFRREALGTLSFSADTLKLESIENFTFMDTTREWHTFTEGEDNYMYAYSPTSVGFTGNTKLARFPKNTLTATNPWQYYSNGTWVNNVAQTTEICPAAFATVTRIGPNNYAASWIAPVSGKIEVWFAPSPIGPWTNPTTVYRVPPEGDIFPYIANTHKETGNNGVYTISYSVIGTIPHMLYDKSVYSPVYVKVNLLALSPYTPAGSLPVSLLSFNGKTEGSVNKLNWQTASEQNCDRFELEYSAEGTAWTKIATVKGSGTTQSKTDYAVTHTTPIKGNNYYRLKQFDFDGKINFSPVINLKLNGPSKMDLQVYPNPAHQDIFFTLSNPADKAITAVVYDVQGKILLTKSIATQPGTTTYKMEGNGLLAKGVYILQIQGEQVKESVLVNVD